MEVFEEGDILPLTDEEGNEEEFEVIGVEENEGATYLALVKNADEQTEEYVILKAVDENGETVLVTVDDDDEFDRISDIFDDRFFSEVDYDEISEEKEN